MNVSEQMQQTPVTIRPDASVAEVAKLMVDRGTTHAVVVDAEMVPVGIVTATDLIAKHAKLHFPTYFSLLGFSFPVEPRRDDREIERALAATVADLMSGDLITV